MAHNLYTMYVDTCTGGLRCAAQFPLKLQLNNVSTREQVACLEGRLSSRHCKARHDYIRINSGSHDRTWLLLVVASGMAEASCLGIEY